MADNKDQSLHLKVAANKFFNALKHNASDKELADIINSEPDLISSKEFIKRTFPHAPKNKNSAGLVPVDKMMQTLRKIKSLEANGLISHEQVEAFLSGKHPQTGETFATYTAKQAVAAYDKANIDRSPEPNFSEDARNKFKQQQAEYSASLKEMEELGVPMDLPNKQGKTAQDLAQLGLFKDTDGQSPAISNQQPSRENSEALHVNINEKDEDLEVGGEEKEALKVNVEGKKALKVNIKPKPKEKELEDEEEATVEDAPEDDKSKGGEYKGDPIKERDIIDYMYNEWFIASLDWAINGTVNHIVNSVDNLCDDFSKKVIKNHQKSIKENKDNYNKTGHRILNDMPTEIHNDYASNAEQTNALWQDVKNNLGKKPQEWTSLDPNNPKQQAFIASVNKDYQENPEICRQKVDSILDKNKQVQNLNNQLHLIAANLAAIELAEQNMKRGKFKRAIHLDRSLSKMSDKKIKKDLAKRTAQKFATLTENIKKLSDIVQLRMAKDGITDSQIIEQKTTECVATYINQTNEQANACKKSISLDLDKENYKYANKEISKETKQNLNGLQNLMDVNKIGDAFLQKEHSDTESHSLYDSAKEMYTNTPAETLMKQYNAESAKTQCSYEDNQKRKEEYNARKAEILNSQSFENFTQNQNNIANNIYEHVVRGKGR